MVMFGAEAVFYRQVLISETVHDNELTSDKECPSKALDKHVRSYVTGELKRKQDLDNARSYEKTERQQQKQKKDPRKSFCPALRKLVDHLKGFKEDRNHEILKVENNIIGTSLVESGDADTIYYLHLDTNEISTEIPTRNDLNKISVGQKSPRPKNTKLAVPNKTDILGNHNSTKYAFGASIMSPGISFLLRNQYNKNDLKSKTSGIQNVNKLLPKLSELYHDPLQDSSKEIKLLNEKQIELRVTNETSVYDGSKQAPMEVPSGDEDESVLNEYHHDSSFDIARKLEFNHSEELSVFQPPEIASTPKQTPSLIPKTLLSQALQEQVSPPPHDIQIQAPSIPPQASVELAQTTTPTESPIQSLEQPITQVPTAAHEIRLPAPPPQVPEAPPQTPSPILPKSTQILDASIATATLRKLEDEVSADELKVRTNLEQIDLTDSINSQNGYDASVESVINESLTDKHQKRTHSKKSDEELYNRISIASISSDYQHPLLIDSSDEELEILDDLFVTGVKEKSFSKSHASETIEDNLTLSYDEYKVPRSTSPFISIDITNSFREEDENEDGKNSNIQSQTGGSAAKESLPSLPVSTVTSPFEPITVEETKNQQHQTRREKEKSISSSGSSSPFEILFV